MVSVEIALRILSKNPGGQLCFATLRVNILWGENICCKPREHSVLASCLPVGSW